MKIPAIQNLIFYVLLWVAGSTIHSKWLYIDYMNNLKIISLGNGGTNILNSIRKHLPHEVATASLCSDNGKIDESDIAPLF